VTGSTAAVRLSTAPNVDAGVAAVGLLHPAGSEPVSIPVTLPNVTRVTTLRATAIADSPGVFAEPNEENNRGTATLEVLPPPRANLYIDNFTVNPGSVARGGSVHVHFQLVNGGDLDATAMSTHYYLSSSPTGEPRIPLEDLGISGLRAQRNMTYDFDVVIPAGTTPGARYFCVRADGANQVVESSEGDNMSALPITVL
jgi:subtilase family serine protease